MFKFFSLSILCLGAVIAYIIYTIWNIAEVFIPPTCTSPDNCLKSFLDDTPDLDLYLFTSSSPELKSHYEIHFVQSVKKFPYLESWERKIPVNIPKEVQNNGSFYMHLFVAPSTFHCDNQWTKLKRNEKSVYFRILLSQYHVPDSFIFNLLKDEKSFNEHTNSKREKKIASGLPITHLKSKITINMLTHPLSLPSTHIPREILNFLKLTPDKKFLPIMTYNFLETRLEDLKLIKNSTEEILFRYSPTYYGKLCLMVQLQSTVGELKKMGFSIRDIDDIKSFFASTNFYLLCITVVISSFHLLFDFLAFKNDVKFWKNKSTMEGLSFRTVLWRAFSHAVIFLFMIDEKASIIVLGPTGIATIIEFWKVLKVLKRRNSTEALDSEKQTNEYDAECMKYLSYLLYPLCVVGALYSLLYQPHKSWYSWCIQSLVNCVYAFGFLFMLPQLFINYRLKSVAALPWRAFMYKAFNTFIDDVFAFIITMPTAHRVACFRDDIIFLVYLYQRWLYPVDKTRVDESGQSFGEVKNLKEKKE